MYREQEIDSMSRNFKVTGAEALLAIAVCERTTSLIGRAETKHGQPGVYRYQCTVQADGKGVLS